ncbi:MAG: cytochrome b/b6 domain-containing protein [Azonexus sp.]|jgi:cytochrome b561|uniref:cytochrome b n=1 Tax=Azonexus sp. TaxID=1872668 RepID=UPI00282FF679|nr:cytochrome b/b6 domain-containing protein [Azonexus sp.]MDR0776746.1 cytochrome b/b6 domain-containing protein [Azonexus sp.]
MNKQTAMTVKRYHAALVALHWLLALLMVVELGLGSTFLKHTPNDMPEKLLALRNHMAAGNLILILTLIRLAVRLKTAHPPPAYGTRVAWNQLTAAGHYALYLLPVLAAVSGLALAVQTDLPQVVFKGIGHLPADFSGHAARAAHGLLAKLLIVLIAGHALAALYHQFVRKDGLLRRMGFKQG